jgi:hypothetical protein
VPARAIWGPAVPPGAFGRAGPPARCGTPPRPRGSVRAGHGPRPADASKLASSSPAGLVVRGRSRSQRSTSRVQLDRRRRGGRRPVRTGRRRMPGPRPGSVSAHPLGRRRSERRLRPPARAAPARPGSARGRRPGRGQAGHVHAVGEAVAAGVRGRWPPRRPAPPRTTPRWPAAGAVAWPVAGPQLPGRRSGRRTGPTSREGLRHLGGHGPEPPRWRDRSDGGQLDHVETRPRGPGARPRVPGPAGHETTGDAVAPG